MERIIVLNPNIQQEKIKCALFDFDGTLLTEHNLSGPELVAFGDGFVEINGDEESQQNSSRRRLRRVSPRQLERVEAKRLTQAGADLLIPDYREWETLLPFLFYEPPFN